MATCRSNASSPGEFVRGLRRTASPDLRHSNRRPERQTEHVPLASHGFPGCVAFDCYGAGQRVTQELFNGMSWRTSDETAVQNLFSAYTSFLALHRLMAMLALAEATVSPPLDTQMRVKREQLNDLCHSEEAKRGSLDIATLQTDVLNLVRKGI